MKKFKFTVSKNQKKYDIVLQSESEVEAKERVHKEGYSILSLEIIDNLDINGNKFLFVVNSNNNINTGAIYGEDIFKVYVKLKKDFGYDILSLYAEKDKDKSDLIKKEILRKIEEEFLLYNKKFIVNKTASKIEVSDKKDKSVIDDFYLKKEVEETYKLIDFVLLKIKSLITSELIVITDEQKSKLEEVFNSINTIKNSRNISKLKEVGEFALKKIGEIELKYVENTKNIEAKSLLKQTNILLKKIGSKDQFIEKDKDLKYIIKNYFHNLKESLLLKISDKKIFLDKETHSYVKTLVLYKKYKEKNEELRKELLANAIVFIYPVGNNKDKKDLLLAKRAVISQNLSLLKAKINGKVFSYTRISKGYKYLENKFSNSIVFLSSYFKIIIYLYSLIFFLSILLDYTGLISTRINLGGITIIIYSIIIFILLSLTRGFFSFAFNIVFFMFLNIFFIVNF